MKQYTRTTWLSRVTTVLLLLLSGYGQAQAQTPADTLDAFLEARMRQQRIPGLQLAVVQKGRVLKLGQYGLANLQDSLPVTQQTRFTINSITKAFVGVAVMQLVEAGMLDLAAPTSRYLSGLPAAWQPVTVRQLLTHTSGLPDIMSDDDMVTEATASAAWAAVQAKPMDFQPGEKFAYNQTNYVLLGKIIDKLSGQPFAQFIQERQLNVVGMPRTMFGDAHDVVPHAARGYTFFHMVDGKMGRSKELRNVFETFPPFLRTAAGLNSTAEELARWVIALQQGKMLKAASLPILWTPGVLNNGTHRGFSGYLNGYALGWPTISRPEHPAVAPVGGGRNALFVYPQDELAIIVLTNLQGANPDNFIDEIAAHYLLDMRATAGFGLPPTILALHQELRKRGFAQATALVKQEKKKNPKYQLPEDEVNAWGYRLLSQGKPQDALEVFKLNVGLYPQSANTYDSLAETYAELGNKELATKNYQRSLALNPKNTSAAEYLKKLGQ
ncbi:serine hydrolase [Hymenobacter taeanensis]|uniref:Serine hydrolase n=1 Tax=Hymenobacter taeanensis TaxID=2735321 RepID=A0A6M6BH43_9BACT|nr:MULTISPECIES: serine hydrolase [Hymenobacter]QJX47369.1 serine hydrolase [Hymenobacter taeanensis]UOQ79291.1 beta-lactamase family protein [Hymenobacter sp. 5414T-23]